MQDRQYIKFGFDLRVVAAILAASLAVGVANNLRMDDERRVPWSGAGIEPAEEQEEEADVDEKRNSNDEEDDDKDDEENDGGENKGEDGE